MKLRGVLGFWGGIFLLTGCGSPDSAKLAPLPLPERPQYDNPKPEPWAVACRDFDQPEPALLASGHLALRIGRDGFPKRGIVLADDYDLGPEEKLRFDRPNPLPAEWMIDGKPLQATQVRDYVQRLDFRTGVLSTEFRVDRLKLGIEWVTSSRLERQVAARAWVEGDLDRVEIRLTPQGDWEDLPWIMTPTESRYKTRREWGWYFSFGKPQAWRKVVDAAISVRESERSLEPVKWHRTVDAFFSAAKFDNQNATKGDIEINGPVEDQQAIRSMLYYLRTGIPRGWVGPGPFGLSNSTYFGHVFWDADVWMYPTVALVYPGLASRISRYRERLMEEYERNYQEWYTAKFGKQPEKRGLMVPWESSWSGRETVPGPSRKQHHITGSVVWMLDLARQLRTDPDSPSAESSRRFRFGAAEFYKNRSIPGPEGREIHDTMSPDEFHIGNNDLYTNILAERAMNFGRREFPVRFKRPRDKTTFLTYDDDPLRKGYKQAAALLAVFPLQDPEVEKEARLMMERYADKVIDNGPAMTHSIHATIWARLGETGKAYEEWSRSWKPYTRHPLLLFSEKRRRTETYFLTGAGGSLQTVLYGFAGIRISEEEPQEVAWKERLRPGPWISIQPNLPRTWRSITLRNIYAGSKVFSFNISHEGVQVLNSQR